MKKRNETVFGIQSLNNKQDSTQAYKESSLIVNMQLYCTPLRCVLFALLALSFRLVVSESVLVTVQTQSQEEMDALTAAIDRDVQNVEGSMRTVLGAIEATMSKVVNVESDYLQTVPRSVPTLALLDDVSMDYDNNVWTFTYESMRVDPNDSLNLFNRVLYMTKEGNSVVGDTGNLCLNSAKSNAECLQNLQSSYTVPVQTLSEGSDFVQWEEDGLEYPIISNISNTENSLVQTISVQIPHQRIVSTVNGKPPLAQKEEITHPTLGNRTQYVFGIGMLFYGAGSNQIIFDQFQLFENSNEQLAIERHNSYAVARHVSFWTQQAKNHPDLRVAVVEYLLEVGHTLAGIQASVNGQEVLVDGACAEMQESIQNTLSDSSCLAQYPLCEPQNYTSTGEEGEQVWATYILPLPSDAEAPFRINTLLNTSMQDGTNILSTLSLETSHPPTNVCGDSITEEFSFTQQVSVTLYRGNELVAQEIQGDFTVYNDTSIGMPDSLMTLVLAPKDEAGMQFFADFPDQQINLDDLYMSHALTEVELPANIHNDLLHAEGGRTTLVLDPALLEKCPHETNGGVTGACVTTHDWTLQGSIDRPHSSPTQYFVRRVIGDDEDRNWLKSFIFGDTTAAAAAFLNRTIALVPEDRREIAQTYWIWPIYAWPDQSPIGLKDKTIVSFTWSITTAAHTNRRLLESGSEAVGDIQKSQSAASESLREKKRKFQQRKAHKELLKPMISISKIKAKHDNYLKKIQQIQRHMPSLFVKRKPVKNDDVK